MAWDLSCPLTLGVGQDPVTCLLPAPGALYTASGQKILMLDAWTNTLVKSFTANPDQVEAAAFQGSMVSLAAPGVGNMVSHMAVCGVGMWVSLDHSSTVSLYHTESFIHMQDINIASNVNRALGGASKRSIHVTALSATKGLLWVGTNVGIALTIPLPRLEGVPIISGKANISYHAHFGPVRMFLTLQPKVHPSEPVARSRQQSTIPEEGTDSPRPPGKHCRKQVSESGLASPLLSKQLLRSKSVASSKDALLARKNSKTLPRGFTIGPGSETSGESVFGLYGDLMNVEEYNVESTGHLEGSHKELRRSDPDLETLPYQVGTLDRRVVMKAKRPRSLDLSSWSMASGGSSQASSSSSQGASPSVSRTASCASDTRSDSNTSDSSWSTGRPGSTAGGASLAR